MRFSRRRWLMATCGLCLGSSVQAQNRQPIADAHNHLGLLRKNEPSAARLGALMTEAGVSLLSWTIVPDAPFLALMSNGIGQARPIASGDLNRAYARQLAGALWRVSGNGAGIVKTVGDIDLAAQGAPHVVLAVEGADFLEGSLDGVGTAYDQGVRHIQLVHSIQNPVGDLQTEPPVHNGLSDFGKQLVRALNQKGILVDLAHSSASSVDQALEIAIQPLVWSHGFLSASEQTFKSRGYQARALSERLARKIAAKGGAVGLWSLGRRLVQVDWMATPARSSA